MQRSPRVAEILDISFSIEHESNCQISFLDSLVSRDNIKLIMNVYRKPTHTEQYPVSFQSWQEPQN